MESSPPSDTIKEIEMDSDNEVLLVHRHRKPQPGSDDGECGVPGRPHENDDSENCSEEEHDSVGTLFMLKEEFMKEMKAMHQAFLVKMGIRGDEPASQVALETVEEPLAEVGPQTGENPGVSSFRVPRHELLVKGQREELGYIPDRSRGTVAENDSFEQASLPVQGARSGLADAGSSRARSGGFKVQDAWHTINPGMGVDASAKLSGAQEALKESWRNCAPILLENSGRRPTGNLSPVVGSTGSFIQEVHNPLSHRENMHPIPSSEKVSFSEAQTPSAAHDHFNNADLHRSHRKKPDTYDGHSSWNDYITHFELVAELNQWSDHVKAMELATSLRGLAQSVLTELSPRNRHDYQSLTNALEARFEPTNQAEMYRAQLNNCLRKRDES